MTDMVVTFEGKEYLVVPEIHRGDSSTGACNLCANHEQGLDTTCHDLNNAVQHLCNIEHIIYLDPARRLEYITARLKGTA